jgi:lipopolysaccharide assembly protein A
MRRFQAVLRGKPMFWIKFIIFAVLLLVVLLFGIEFSTLNADPVPFHYLHAVAELPLSLLLVGAFATGVAVTLVVGAFIVYPLRWQTARLRQTIASKDQEIAALSRKLGREAH